MVEQAAEELRRDTQRGSPGATEGKRVDRHDALPSALEKGNLNAVKHYLDSGGDPNATVDGNSLPLHKVIRYGHADIAALLVRRGADVNGRDAWGCTPLHYAVVSQGPGGRCLPDIALLLLEEGGDPNARSNDGWSPLMSALDNGQQEMAALLRQHGAHE